MGITCEDVLFAIFDFFASPLYVDELGGMCIRHVKDAGKGTDELFIFHIVKRCILEQSGLWNSSSRGTCTAEKR